MLRMEQSELAEKAQISVETVKRLEAQDGPILTGRAALSTPLSAPLQRQASSSPTVTHLACE
jgi:hypothetical protein